MLRLTRWPAWAIVAYLLAAATYELVLAVGKTPSPSGDGFVLLAALIAMLVGLVFTLRRHPAAGLIAPAAALFVTARVYTGDPYYEPDFHSYADGGIFSATWIWILLLAALVAGATTHRWHRTVPVESAIVLLLLAFTALFMGSGH